jgi:hypothetical protein
MVRSYINFLPKESLMEYYVYESINNSVDEVDTSLYRHPGLNPFVISPVKSLTKTFTSSHFFVF